MSPLQAAVLLFTCTDSFAHTLHLARSCLIGLVHSPINPTWVAILVDMAEPISDIHMEDGDPASNDQMFLPDFDGLDTAFSYDEYLASEMNTSSFNVLPEGQNGMFYVSSTNLLPLEQSLLPQGQAFESDTLCISPNASHCNYSTWTHGHSSGGAQEPVSFRTPQSIVT